MFIITMIEMLCCLLFVQGKSCWLYLNYSKLNFIRVEQFWNIFDNAKD